MKHFFFVFLIISILCKAHAQVQFSGWVASFNTFKLNNKLSLHFDAQIRSTDELKNLQTILFRPGLNVHLNKQWVVTAGYAFISNRRSVSGLSDLLPEHRVWQQVLFSHKTKNISISHRFRFEERFISKATIVNNEVKATGHDEAFRFRYFIRSIIPLTKQKSFSKGLFFALQNEVFFNTGNKSFVNGKGFDQNRLYAAIGYRLKGKIDLEAGYMNQYTSTRASFSNNHIAQIAVYKRL